MPFEPGDIVREFARRNSWPIRRYNIIVEGDGDREYFELADSLYWTQHQRRLLGDELGVFPPGSGDEGGTSGIQRHFPALRSIINSDVSADGKTLFSVVALLDKDQVGVRAAAALTAQYTRLLLYRDVFTLDREFPIVNGTVDTVKKTFRDANASWRSIDCEIEDLIQPELVDCFVAENSSCQPRVKHENGRRHYDFPAHAKAPLRRYVQQHAMLSDVEGLINVLRGIRYYMGLNPDGSGC